MNREDFDQLFDQAFDDAARSSQFIPDPARSWARIEKKLARRAKVRRRMKLVPYIAASFLFGAYIFGTPAVSTAFRPVIEAVETLRNGVIDITVGRPNGSGATIPKTAPPPGFVKDEGLSPQEGLDVPGSDVVSVRHDSMKKAAQHLTFAPPEIRHVLNSYELSNIETFRAEDKDKGDQLSIRYEKKSGEPGLYRIMIRKWQPNMMMEITSNDPSIPTETLVLNGYEAYLQVTDEGSASIQFFADDLHVMIIGMMSREDILSIAENMRFR